jgi:SagB-type dehydrogenase family enzyme
MTQPTISAREYHQRDPFRRFAGCQQIPLPLKARELAKPYADLFLPDAPAKPLGRENIAILCELAMGLSAWKVYGSSRWSLRCNPSSGNLHPSEAYLVLPEVDALAPGVYHYASHDHALEQRCKANQELSALLPAGSFLVGLSSIHWREAWKYGERAYRYCQLDIGHLMAAIRYAAACLGWRVTWQPAWGDDDINSVLGIDRQADFKEAEAESPDTILLVETLPQPPTLVLDIPALSEACRQGQWQGQANGLSEEHEFNWPVIEQVAQACIKPETEYMPQATVSEEPPGILKPDYLQTPKATDIIRQRRSAQAFDGTSMLSFSAFCRMLDALMPRKGIPPFDMGAAQGNIHLVLFVHRVEGLNPGLYCLPRSHEGEKLLRTEFSDQFQWQRLDNIPDNLPLYLLVRAKCGQAAHTLSCHQPIAADSAFSLAMIAEFEHPLEMGDWMYRQLFWEAGILGQSLYLEAEAAGVRGTGIGCYFDDKVHEILGIQGERLQDLYHFTVGTPTIDARLATLPPYSHLKDRGQ